LGSQTEGRLTGYKFRDGNNRNEPEKPIIKDHGKILFGVPLKSFRVGITLYCSENGWSKVTGRGELELANLDCGTFMKKIPGSRLCYLVPPKANCTKSQPEILKGDCFGNLV